MFLGKYRLRNNKEKCNKCFHLFCLLFFSGKTLHLQAMKTNGWNVFVFHLALVFENVWREKKRSQRLQIKQRSYQQIVQSGFKYWALISCLLIYFVIKNLLMNRSMCSFISLVDVDKDFLSIRFLRIYWTIKEIFSWNSWNEFHHLTLSFSAAVNPFSTWKPPRIARLRRRSPTELRGTTCCYVDYNAVHKEK